MPRLLAPTGDAVMGIAGVVTSINGTQPPGLLPYSGGGWDWLDSDRIVGQGLIAGTAALYTYRISTDAVVQVSPLGANNVEAGGGNWTAWLGGSGWRTSTGLGPDPNTFIGNVSEIGEMGVISDTAVNSYRIYDASNNVIDSFGLQFWATPTTIRDGVFSCLTRDGGEGLRNYATSSFLNLFIRTGCSWVTHVVDAGTIWLLERGPDGALTIRKKDDSFGWLVEPAAPTIFNPDVVVTSAGNVRIAWSLTAGEEPNALVGVQLDLATGVNTRGTVVAGAWTFAAAAPLTVVTFAGSAGSGGASGGTGGSGAAGGNYPSGEDTLKGDSGVARVRRGPQQREYPEVARIPDGPTQRTLKLLWDKIWEFNDRFTSQEALIGTHESALASAANEIARVRTLAESTGIAATLPTGSLGVPPIGPGQPPSQPPVTPPPGTGGGSDTDDGLAGQGCNQHGPTGHVPSGSPLDAITFGMIVCGTGQEFSGLTVPVADEAARIAQQAELLGRTIWHVALAGFQTGKQRNPSGAISNDKITVQIDGVWRAYDIFTGTPPSEPFTVKCDQVFPAQNVPDGGIAD